MPLHIDPDDPPKTIGSGTTLAVAETLMKTFENCGMSDVAAEDNFEITDGLVEYCCELLKSQPRATYLYLLAVKAMDRRSRGSMFRAAVRMAAQRDKLQRDKCPEVSPKYTQNCWVGAFLMRKEEYFDKERNRHKLKVRFMIYTGARAGDYVMGTYSRNFRFVMESTLGMALGHKYKSLDNISHIDATNFARALVFVETRKSTIATRVNATPGMVSYNRKLVRSRFREIYSCPFGAMFDCVQCSAFTDECSRAIRIRND